jgi:hypothetical protein
MTDPLSPQTLIAHRVIAERIVRDHDMRCVGEVSDTEPWCSTAPDGHPLCEACRTLAESIEAALLEAVEAALAASPVEPLPKCCGAPAPDGSVRTCDKPAGHEGGHWSYGGNSIAWAEAAPGRARRAEMSKNEFKNLSVGDVVRSLFNDQTCIVTANYGDRVTAVQTADITNPTEWQLVVKMRPEPAEQANG